MASYKHVVHWYLQWFFWQLQSRLRSCWQVSPDMNAAKILRNAVKDTKKASQKIVEVLFPGPLRVRVPCYVEPRRLASSTISCLAHSTQLSIWYCHTQLMNNYCAD